MARSARLELFEGQIPGRWYFHRRAANGKITDASQGYTRKADAKRAARRLFPDLPVIVVERAA